jgi:hypothetical protein
LFASVFEVFFSEFQNKKQRIEMNVRNTLLATAVLLAAGNTAAQINEDKENQGEFYGDFRLRYESVSQNNPLPDADALTLRSRLAYKSASYEGFSGVIEVENSTSLIDDFSVPPSGERTGQFSVVADPEGTEIDQAFIQFANEKLTAKIGRQVFALDGHRFVGHVGWRQDRQTFDAVVVNYKPADGFVINASYIDKRNRIFAEDADIDSKDTILNTSYKMAAGKLVAYAYLLETDSSVENSIDTFGLSFSGAQKVGDNKVLYTAEYATQDTNDTFDTNYLLLEGGVVFSSITAKLGYEVLGSDDGLKGFATPLATLHKFNGWSDQFLGTPNQGLENLYLSFAGKLAGGKWLATYHEFSSDETLHGADDLGDEINLQYARKFGDWFSGGIKFASYSAGDAGFSKVDTDKFWIWASAKF